MKSKCRLNSGSSTSSGSGTNSSASLRSIPSSGLSSSSGSELAFDSELRSEFALQFEFEFEIDVELEFEFEFEFVLQVELTRARTWKTLSFGPREAHFWCPRGSSWTTLVALEPNLELYGPKRLIYRPWQRDLSAMAAKSVVRRRCFFSPSPPAQN